MSDNTQRVTEAYECFARGDIPSLLEMMSDDVDWETPGILPQSGTFRGRDGVGEFFAGVAESWSELEVDSEDLVADGDHVLSLGQARGKLSGGADADYRFCHAFTLNDGQIVRFREYVMADDKIG